MTRAVFLDRDGVINAKPAEGSYVTDRHGFRFLPGVVTALARLRTSDPAVRLIVLSNQRGIALGLVDQATVDDIHRRMRTRLEAAGGSLDGVYVCPHHLGTCDCRKPEPGLFQQAFADFPDIEPDRSVMVGDSLADVQAAQRVGVRAFLVGPARRRRAQLARAKAQSVPVAGTAPSLSDLVESGAILG